MFAFLLASCGFEPMYGTPSTRATIGQLVAQVGLGSISIPERNKQRLVEQFRAELQDLIRPDNSSAAAAPYLLDVQLLSNEAGIAVSRDGTFSRFNVNVYATLTLTRISDNIVVYRGLARRSSTYNNTPNAYYSTYIASQDAQKRATTELAEDVRMRLTAFFASNPNPGAWQKTEPPKAIPVPTLQIQPGSTNPVLTAPTPQLVP